MTQNHSKQIEGLRALATTFNSLVSTQRDLAQEYQEDGKYRKAEMADDRGDRFTEDAVLAIAVADLLEIHDCTGLNLGRAPGLKDFVERVGSRLIGPFVVWDNGA